MSTDLEKVSGNVSLEEKPSDVTPSYKAKSTLINHHVQTEIGFGPYQLQLFFLTGLGWAADNIWLQGVAIILPQIKNELVSTGTRVEYATLALYAGLIVGATMWGMISDFIGRKMAFNITLFIAAVFGIAGGGANSFVTLCGIIAVLGFGVGGNLPVDGAIFLEHVPGSHQWLLTLLSAFWALGQVFASLVAWPLISNFSCVTAEGCTKEQNMGWRYTFYTLGGVTALMWILRFFLFDLQESPKYLVAKGRDEEALRVLQHVARKNGKTLTLTLEQLQAAGGESMSTKQVIKESFAHFNLSHIRPLFSTRKLALNTSLVLAIWALLGLAYPLFNGFITLYLTTQVPSSLPSMYQTYRDYTIIASLGVPGSIIACLVVDYTRRNDGEGRKWVLGGRKMTMAVSTALTGVFLFLFTTSKTQQAVLGFSCASSLTQNAMYGVLYAYTPEVFPAPHRGTGDSLASAASRVAGILSPIIKIATTTREGVSVGGAGTANGPIFVAATLFVVASALMMMLPIETAGKAAL